MKKHLANYRADRSLLNAERLRAYLARHPMARVALSSDDDTLLGIALNQLADQRVADIKAGKITEGPALLTKMLNRR